MGNEYSYEAEGQTSDAAAAAAAETTVDPSAVAGAVSGADDPKEEEKQKAEKTKEGEVSTDADGNNNSKDDADDSTKQVGVDSKSSEGDNSSTNNGPSAEENEQESSATNTEAKDGTADDNNEGENKEDEGMIGDEDVDAEEQKDQSTASAVDDEDPESLSGNEDMGPADEEVERAKALAQFIEIYGEKLSPEQIANITPEQIARLAQAGNGNVPKITERGPPPLTPSARPRARPIVELREYDLNPMYAHSYLHHTAAKSTLRKSLSPLRLFAIPETGGDLNVATHLYHWQGGYKERNARKTEMAQDEEWREYIKKVQPALRSQRSTIFMEAAFVYDIDGIVGLEMGRAESYLRMRGRNTVAEVRTAVYEICRYKLKLGYDIIPRFLQLYEKGLPSKLDAEGTDPSTNLITLMYSTVGTLNEIIEIWRHGEGFDAMERSGAAAQSARDWRESGEAIASLTVEVTRTIYKPMSFSPLL